MSSSSDLKALLLQLRTAQGDDDSPAGSAADTKQAASTSNTDENPLFSLLGSLKPVPREWLRSEPAEKSEPPPRASTNNARRDVKTLSFAQAVPLLGQYAQDKSFCDTFLKVKRLCFRFLDVFMWLRD
jgi:hypothetical protein